VAEEGKLVAPRRATIGTFVLPDTNTNAIVLVYSTGFTGGGTQGYLKARSSNAASLRISNDNDATTEPYAVLAAGETLPIALDFEKVAQLFARGSAADVVEFVSDASE
jgi:hypothetical protein